MQKIMVAIVDRVANDIVGPIQLFRHATPAMRMFGDVCADTRTSIAQHVKDHELRQIGEVDEDTMQITNTIQVVLITGEAWLAGQPKGE